MLMHVEKFSQFDSQTRKSVAFFSKLFANDSNEMGFSRWTWNSNSRNSSAWDQPRDMNGNKKREKLLFIQTLVWHTTTTTSIDNGLHLWTLSFGEFAISARFSLQWCENKLHFTAFKVFLLTFHRLRYWKLFAVHSKIQSHNFSLQSKHTKNI